MEKTVRQQVEELEQQAKLLEDTQDALRLLDRLEERVRAMEAENARLREALPDPDKLEIIAQWFDRVDAAFVEYGIPTAPEIQTDVRAWAAKIRSLLEGRSNGQE